ncbi:MAG TPA: helix-turn-helix transcriptional regulator [Mycobacteriales bacterium]|nr:helix-turn-helix transcriptional regulator [Mycobacteriales bacterium]
MGVSPLVRRRHLAAQLRRLRAADEKSIEQVAEHLECSVAKVRQLEAGQTAIRSQEVRELLDYYTAAGPERENLLDLARQARGRGWWHAYEGLISEEFMTFLHLEDEASCISTYENYFIPGLLQTERYARAVMARRPQTPPIDMDRGLELRRMRWRLLYRADALTISALIDESALGRIPGGSELRDEQCDHLVTLSAMPNVAVQILPLLGGAYPNGGSAFTLLGFTDLADPKVAYAELLIGEHYTDNAKQIGWYQSAFAQLQARALSPDESVALIKACGRELQ